jgi:hypothetical protein
MSVTETKPASTTPSWAKPFAGAWRARAYFAIAFVFWVLSSTIPIPFSEIPATQHQWWQDLIAKGVGSLDKIAYLVFAAGLFYAVISDVFDYVWANSLQTEFRTGVTATGDILKNGLASFTSGLVGMTFESVKVWVEGGRGKPDQIRTIGACSLKSYYGTHHTANSNMIDFVLDDILEYSAMPTAQVWEHYSTNIVIRPSNIPDHFEWEERRNYDAVCPSRTETLPLRLEGSTQVSANRLLDALNKMDFTIKFGSVTKVDFQQWWKGVHHRVISTNGKIEPFRIVEQGITLEYNGIVLRHDFAVEFEITQERTPVAIYERSYIGADDRCYSISVRHPTHNLHASLSIEGDLKWVVKPPVASAKLYKQGQTVVQIESQHVRTCTVKAPGWTLPGVAVVMEWTPDRT